MKRLLLAAGLGTRLHLLTNSVSKCMVPIHGRPLLDYWLELLLPRGFQRLLVNTHHLPDAMRDFVAQSAWRYSVAVVHEVELVGAGGTILCNRAYLEGDALFGRPRRQSHALRSCCVARHRTRPQGVGRPDMAMYIFASAILDGRPIRLFNHGNMRRDFTYVDDVTQAVVRVLEQAPAPDPGWSGDAPDPARSAAPWRIYNIGNNKPVEIARVVELLEAELGRPAVKELVPMQPGDVPETCADVDDLMRDVGFRPATPIEEGIRRFAVWYRAYRQHPHG